MCYLNVILTLGTTKFKKNQLGANQCSKINSSRFWANEMRINKLFSKLRLVKNLQFGRGKRRALLTENREHFFFFPYNLAFFSRVRLYVIGNNNFLLKISNPMTFSNFIYIENWPVSLCVCPTDISEGCHKYRHTLIYLPAKLATQYKNFNDQNILAEIWSIMPFKSWKSIKNWGS